MFMKDIFQECTNKSDIEGEIDVTEEDLSILFEELDLDQTGRISKSEFRKLIRDSTGL